MNLNFFSHNCQTIFLAAYMENANKARSRCVRYQLERELLQVLGYTI